MKIILATGNRDKVREIEAIMAPLDVELLRPETFADLPDVVEDGDTFEHNALKKAREVRDFTGVSALADDSGLEVDALGGAPGVYSSRYAGENVTYEDNNSKLLQEMAGLPEGRRQARFRCVMALALADGDIERLETRRREIPELAGQLAGEDIGDALVTHGVLEGRITTARRGPSGFGFDPVFELPGLGQTLAEMGPARKNEISHRYRALVEMREMLLRFGLAAARRSE